MNDYLQMTKVINYLTEHATEQPCLKALADMAGLSPYYFQRKFIAWTGVSPKSFQRCLNLEHARKLLEQGNTVFDAALDTGLSGPGRLHDLCVSLEAATPGEIRNGGAGLQIRYGFGPTPFGACILASSPRGICYLAFIDNDDYDQAVSGLRDTWPGADLTLSEKKSMQFVRQIFSLQRKQRQAPLRAFVKGTDFQLQVWRALLRVKEGRLVTYGELASDINRPAAARAVGSAVGANPLAYLIPCHRVIRSSGIIGDYRWGSHRKKAIIACETARTFTPVAS